ncbi:MAG TPA: hypothetical protein VF746_26340 [Longimicrobium sp.]|jgi:hypothetical protein
MRASAFCALAFLFAVACARGETDVGDRRAAAAQVGQLLYAENLISDPEVNAKVGGYVTAVDRDGAPLDSVLPDLHTWLVEWAARHPDRVARARMMPWASQPPVPRARAQSAVGGAVTLQWRGAGGSPPVPRRSLSRKFDSTARSSFRAASDPRGYRLNRQSLQR